MLSGQLSLLVSHQLCDIGLDAHVVRQAGGGGVVDGREGQVVDEGVAVLLVVEQLRDGRAARGLVGWRLVEGGVVGLGFGFTAMGRRGRLQEPAGGRQEQDTRSAQKEPPRSG